MPHCRPANGPNAGRRIDRAQELFDLASSIERANRKGTGQVSHEATIAGGREANAVRSTTQHTLVAAIRVLTGIARRVCWAYKAGPVVRRRSAADGGGSGFHSSLLSRPPLIGYVDSLPGAKTDAATSRMSAMMGSMSGSPIIADTWRAILDGAPGARRGDSVIIEAAYRHPVVRRLFPFPTHGTLVFFRTAPASLPVSPEDELPFIVGGGPYQIYTPGYGKVLGEAATADEAVALLAANLPDAPSAANPAH